MMLQPYDIQMMKDMKERDADARDLDKWLKAGAFALETPNGSHLHKLREAVFDYRVEVVPKYLFDAARDMAIVDAKVFVVEHDWAAALSGAHDYDEGEWRLPFEWCCFEFRVSGRRVIAVRGEGGGFKPASTFIEAGGRWVSLAHVQEHSLTSTSLRESWDRVWKDYGALIKLVDDNIRAVCIALDAEVASEEKVRAPHKLNAARERKGRAPLLDYHVVSLARRPRAAPLPRTGEPEAGKVRLHFRRGHWRHYENHKTWIKWTLVGNPDLGFINKHYRL